MNNKQDQIDIVKLQEKLEKREKRSTTLCCVYISVSIIVIGTFLMIFYESFVKEKNDITDQIRILDEEMKKNTDAQAEAIRNGIDIYQCIKPYEITGYDVKDFRISTLCIKLNILQEKLQNKKKDKDKKVE